MAGKVGTDYAVAFPARTGNGALAPGIAIVDFTVRLRCLTTSTDAAGGDIPTIVDEGSGDYSAVIGNAFTIVQGPGEYYLRVSVNSAAPRVRDVVSFDVEFHLRDFDDLAEPGDPMDLVANAVDAAAIATDAIDADALAADAVAEIQAGLATAAALALVETEAAAAIREATNTAEHALTVAGVATVLSTGGAGPWTTGAGVSDWTAAERSQFRDALGIDGVKVVAVGGQLQSIALEVSDILEMEALEIGESKTLNKPTGDGVPNQGSIVITRSAGPDKVFELERGNGGETLIVRRTA